MKLFINLVFILFISNNIFAEQTIKRNLDITKEVIYQQLGAFKINDANKAYFFASPIIKKRFESPESFMDMIKKNYEPVSNAKDFFFLKSKFYNESIYHQVQIISQSNKSYIATYSLIFTDEEWKISGCAISLMDQQSI